MPNRDLLSRIENGMPTFSKSQKKIGIYISEHYDKAAFMTASRLGEEVGVSESTVVRFAAEIGFDGYPELQKNLREMIRSRLTTVQRIGIIDDRIGTTEILTKVMTLDSDRIRRTCEEISPTEFCDAVESIIAARRIYVLGVRSSSMISNFLVFYFNHIFDNVVSVNSNTVSEVFEQMLRIGGEDVFIALSFPRYSQRTVKAARFAKDRGAKVIAITDSNSSPIAQFADVLLLARSEMASFVDSLVAPLSLINALIVAIGMCKKAEVKDTYATLERIWEEYDVYEKPQRDKDEN